MADRPTHLAHLEHLGDATKFSPQIHALIPHSTLTVFERSGHSPQVEERDAFTRELAAFFAGLAADGVA